jgi:hypothetical protein
VDATDSRRPPDSSWFVASSSRRAWLCLIALAAITSLAGGCKRNPRVVPVSGIVYYNDKPLPYGTVMFQPDKGQPASGEIQPDGTFKLSSYGPDDGAVPGRHLVSVSCYEGQRPAAQTQVQQGDGSLGRLLIPLRYTRLASSGLTAEIKDESSQTVELRLTGPAVKF